MIPVDDPHPGDPKRGRLADERRILLEALDGDALAGPAVLRRMRERSGPAAGGREYAHVDESRLYPTLYSLEAAWRVRATWLPDDRGVWHRVYSRRRLRPIREQGVQQG